MSSVDPNGKEVVRRREPGERSTAGTSSVASLVRVLDESRLKPKAKEQEVLDVATEYFLQHGYRGASINAMARSSGISKESIYRYFSSKQQLFEAVIGRELIEYRRSLHRLDATLRSMELRAALIMVAETILGIIMTDRTQALRRLIFDEATRSPEVGQHYYKIGPGKPTRCSRPSSRRTLITATSTFRRSRATSRVCCRGESRSSDSVRCEVSRRRRRSPSSRLRSSTIS